ncbi:MAG: DUF4347 domain-containing protein, partial [Burkholderiaceae bacterium]
MPNKRPSNILVVEPIEPRILYSADLNPLMAASAVTASLPHLADMAQSAATYMTNQVAVSNVSEASDTQVQRHEIVFVDSAISGYQQLADTLRKENVDTRSLEVVIIESGQDGIAQISAALASRHDLNAIHIISHGDPGEILVGDTHFNNESLFENAAAVSQWGHALANGADILLYGCDVAANPAGQQFVNGLGLLTGADVSASNDLTGASRLGGNWVLEYASGHIETAGVVNATAQAQFDSVLATYTVTNT